MSAVWTGQEGDGTTAAQVAQDVESREKVCRRLRAYMLMMGSLGATTNELYAQFGPSAVKRLNDIRQKDASLDYRKRREGSGYRYWLYTVTPAPLRRSRPVEPSVTTPRLF